MTDSLQPPQFDGGSNRENWVSLREYFERRLFDMERATQASLRNSEIAIGKAEQATTYRLALLNESRDSLKDQTRLYVTRVEFDGLRDAAQSEIKSLRETTQSEINNLREATQSEIKSLQRIVYTLTGGLAVIQVIVQFLANRG